MTVKMQRRSIVFVIPFSKTGKKEDGTGKKAVYTEGRAINNKRLIVKETVKRFVVKKKKILREIFELTHRIYLFNQLPIFTIMNKTIVQRINNG